MQLLFAIPDKRLCSGIGQNKVHDRDLKEAHQERLTHIPRRKAPPVGLEPTTPCPASRANNSTDFVSLRQLGRPAGCGLLSIRSRCSNSIEKSKTEKATRCVTFSVLAPPVGLEPTTPCNNPTDFAMLRQLRKFTLSAGSEGQTLRSAALRAAASESTKSLVKFKRKKQKEGHGRWPYPSFWLPLLDLNQRLPD